MPLAMSISSSSARQLSGMKSIARASRRSSIKVQRSAAAAAQRALKVELQDERLAAQQQITDLQAIITRQDRALNSAHAALRSSLKQTESEMGKLQAEMQKVSEGRIWSRVREEEEKRRRAEVKVSEVQAQLDEARMQLHQRSVKVRVSPCPARPLLSPATDTIPIPQLSMEKDELISLRSRMKQLREKLATYDCR